MKPIAEVDSNESQKWEMMSKRKKIKSIFNSEVYQEQMRLAAEKGIENREKTAAFLKVTGIRSKKAAKVVAEKTVVAAGKTQGAVNKGIHKALGADEYKKAALEVNARLSVALDSLEDAVIRRDEDILRLNARIEELEALLKRTGA